MARWLLAPKLTPAGEPVFNPAISTLYLKGKHWPKTADHPDSMSRATKTPSSSSALRSGILAH